MNAILRNRIRDRLSSLQSENGETLFEQVCAEIARRRFHLNINSSSFVAGHGDKGRDFENVPGHIPHLVGSKGQEDGLKPDDSFVGACTLGRSDPPGKIRGDVETIHTKGPKPKFIYYFCETDFPSATQTDLCNWCQQTYGTTLKILTGKTLADWLAEPDLASALDLLGLAALPPPRCVLPPINTEGFVGREGVMERLTKALVDDEAPAAGRIMGLYGSPGVGKSGLAIHFARLNLDRFPDGVFGVDLRDVDNSFDALTQLAIALGEPLTSEEQGFPPHQIAQTRFAHLRCLILLDNLEHANTLKQIRPGGRASMLITCRDRDVLAKFAVPAEFRVAVERLPRDESIAYLRSALGTGTDTPKDVDALANALRDLPLALRIGSQRVGDDPIVRGRVDRFLTRLHSPTRVEALNVPGEADLNLVRLFDLSLEGLSEDEPHAFACLSVCTAKGFGARAAAAAVNQPDPMPLIGRLARLSLLEVDQTTARFRFHPLVHEYAWHLADQWGLAPAARTRHAEAMANLLRERGELSEIMADQEDLRHGLEYFAESGRVDLPLLQGLSRLVEQAALGHWHIAFLERVSERLDPKAQNWIGAVLLLQQGKRHLALGHLDEAHAAFAKSLEIGSTLNDRRGEAMVLNSLGGVLRDLGRLDEAHAAFAKSLEIRSVLNDRHGEAMVLNSLGWLKREYGDPEGALYFLERSRAILRDLSLPVLDFLKGELKTLRGWSRQLLLGTHQLAEYHLAMEKRRTAGKDWNGAVIHMRRNLALETDPTDRRERTERLSYAYFQAKRLSEAIDTYRSALEEGPLSPVGFANLGRALHLADRDLNEAENHLRQACSLQPENAWARSWLGLLLTENGHLDQGEREARQALVTNEHHAVLLFNLARVLARFPDHRGDKLREALEICFRAKEEASFPIRDLDALVSEVHLRLASPQLLIC